MSITRVDRWWSEEPTPLAPPHPGLACEATWVDPDGCSRPCGDPAAAWRIDAEDESIPWAVCFEHTSPEWAHS